MPPFVVVRRDRALRVPPGHRSAPALVVPPLRVLAGGAAEAGLRGRGVDGGRREAGGRLGARARHRLLGPLAGRAALVGGRVEAQAHEHVVHAPDLHSGVGAAGGRRRGDEALERDRRGVPVGASAHTVTLHEVRALARSRRGAVARVDDRRGLLGRPGVALDDRLDHAGVPLEARVQVRKPRHLSARAVEVGLAQHAREEAGAGRVRAADLADAHALRPVARGSALAAAHPLDLAVEGRAARVAHATTRRALLVDGRLTQARALTFGGRVGRETLGGLSQELRDAGLGGGELLAQRPSLGLGRLGASGHLDHAGSASGRELGALGAVEGVAGGRAGSGDERAAAHGLAGVGAERLDPAPLARAVVGAVLLAHGRDAVRGGGEGQVPLLPLVGGVGAAPVLVVGRHARGRALELRQLRAQRDHPLSGLERRLPLAELTDLAEQRLALRADPAQGLAPGAGQGGQPLQRLRADREVRGAVAPHHAIVADVRELCVRLLGREHSRDRGERYKRPPRETSRPPVFLFHGTASCGVRTRSRHQVSRPSARLRTSSQPEKAVKTCVSWFCGVSSQVKRQA